MARSVRTQDFPLAQVRRWLEPGAVVLISSRWQGRDNIMTAGWHTVMDFTPSLVGCVIAQGNHSHAMIRDSRQCVINLPTTALTEAVVGIGNSTGAEVDKFRTFGLTPAPATRVEAPLIGECHAQFECVLHDDALVARYGFFVFEVVAAHVAVSPQRPETLHYRGGGEFMLPGRYVSRKAKFTKVS